MNTKNKENLSLLNQNYLERIPIKKDTIHWTKNENEEVTICIQNKGFFNKAAQSIFDVPKITHIHLDKIGSFIWLKLDGNKNIIEIGKDVENQFKEKASPLYERLTKFFTILENYNFIDWKI